MNFQFKTISTIFFHLFTTCVESSYQQDAIRQNSILDPGPTHTALIQNVEFAIAKKTPKDIAEYMLYLVDSCEQHFCTSLPEEKNNTCLREVHKSIVFGAINFHPIGDSLMTTPSASGKEMLSFFATPDDPTNLVLISIQKFFGNITSLTHKNKENVIRNLHNIQNGLLNDRTNPISREIAMGAMSIGIESAKLWLGVNENRQSPFHLLLNQMKKASSGERKSGEIKISDSNLGNSGRHLQFIIGGLLALCGGAVSVISGGLVVLAAFFSVALAAFFSGAFLSFAGVAAVVAIASVVIFDIYGFLVGISLIQPPDFANFVTSDNVSPITAVTASAYFSTLGQLKCVLNPFKCIEAVVDFWNQIGLRNEDADEEFNYTLTP